MTSDLVTAGASRAVPGGCTVFQVASPDLGAAVRDLSGLRLADMFASDGDAPALRLVWARDAGGGQPGYVITETPIADGEYPPLSDIAPAAFIEECEIYEQFGIRPATGKPLNRVMLPPHTVLPNTGLPTLGRKPPSEPEEVRAPHSVAGEAFEFPFGPVRQAGVESLYYGLVTSGEEVVDLYLFTWHKHRGIEWRLQGKTPQQALFFAERAEGLSAVAQGWAFAAAAEAATGTRPAAGAQRTRAVALELERLYNHAAAMAALCQSTGLSVGQSAAEIALERLLRLNARAFGHRYLFGVVAVGGVSRSPDHDAIRQDLPGAYGEFKRAAAALLSTNSFVDRLEATGILTTDQARRLGLVGPDVQRQGVNNWLWSDHTDIQPTMMELLGLRDDYTPDGRALIEVIDPGALPPAVMGIVYVTTPGYITLLFTEKAGNLMLAGCAILDAIRQAFPLPRLRVADRGLREGMLVEMMREDGLL